MSLKPCQGRHSATYGIVQSCFLLFFCLLALTLEPEPNLGLGLRLQSSDTSPDSLGGSASDSRQVGGPRFGRPVNDSASGLTRLSASTFAVRDVARRVSGG